MLPNPYYYFMTPALAQLPVDIVCVTTDHNLNMLLNFRRTHPWISFVVAKEEEAYNFLTEQDGVGVGCHVVEPNHPAMTAHRRRCARFKADTLATYAKGFEPIASVEVRKPVLVERPKRTILRLFMSGKI